MAFADLSSELAGNLPGVSGFLTATWIQRAWRRIRDARLWSFLITDDAIVCPAQITVGSFNIAQFSNTVTANAAASAALLPFNTSIEVPLQFLQLRFQASGTTSQIYNIVSVNATNPSALVFTLDRVVVEATNPVSSYLCYRAYVAAPGSGFLRWISVVDMVNGWSVDLDHTSTYFDAIDPQRGCLGQAFYLGGYKQSSDLPPNSTVPIYELWPGPSSGQTFYVRYRSRGIDFVNPTDQQPDVIPDDLIIQTALAYYAYPWAAANIGHFPAMKGTNWLALIQDAKRSIHGDRSTSYRGMLQDAKRQDDNAFMTSVFNRGHGLRDNPARFPYPIDAGFLQSHLVPL